MITEPGNESLETWVDIDQLLTGRGKETRFVDFVTGNVVKEGEGFVGKKRVLAEVEAKAAEKKVAVLQSGFRAGKTSLLSTAADHLIEQGRAEKKLFFDLQSGAPPDVIEKRVKKMSENGEKLVIVVDEIAAYNPDFFSDLVDKLEGFIRRGSIVLIGVNGDLTTRGKVPGELGDEQKTALLRIAGESLVINPLMTDDEIRDLVSAGAPAVFTDAATNYLVKESGGHPFNAGLLASELFNALIRVKEKDLNITDLSKEVRGKMYVHYNGLFKSAVDEILARGFNPLTWEYTGPPEYSPNVEVYRNMLPRESSAVFHGWLEKYLGEKG